MFVCMNTHLPLSHYFSCYASYSCQLQLMCVWQTALVYYRLILVGMALWVIACAPEANRTVINVIWSGKP